MLGGGRCIADVGLFLLSGVDTIVDVSLFVMTVGSEVLGVVTGTSASGNRAMSRILTVVSTPDGTNRTWADEGFACKSTAGETGGSSFDFRV